MLLERNSGDGKAPRRARDLRVVGSPGLLVLLLTTLWSAVVAGSRLLRFALEGGGVWIAIVGSKNYCMF